MPLGSRKVAIAAAFVLIAALIGVGLGVLLPGPDNTFELDDKTPNQAAVDGPADQLQLPGELYVPNGRAATWVRENPDDPRVKVIANTIANQPAAVWFGEWTPDLGAEVQFSMQEAAQRSTVPVFVNYSAQAFGCEASLSQPGGVDTYLRQVEAMARGIGEGTAVLILEPNGLDNLDNLDCVSGREKELRLEALNAAVDLIGELSPNALVYLGGGPNADADAATMAQRLAAAGLAKARGFVVNLGSHNLTESMVAYAEDINRTLEADVGYRKPYVMDSSRNGAPVAVGCNPKDARLGELPRVAGLEEGPEMFLWVTSPGESDGDCGLAPGTGIGEFVPELAMSLLRGP